MSDIPPLRGLLSDLADPVAMARFKERDRLVDHLAERAGCSRRIARGFLTEFETADPRDFGLLN
jgi:hypothetical protein